MEALTKTCDMLARQLALSRKNKRNGALATKFRNDVPLSQAVPLEKKPQHVDRAGFRDGIPLCLIMLNEKRQQLDRLSLVRSRFRL